jgi:hypothetical protein
VKDPAISPDESRIVYVVERSGRGEIWLMSVNGNAPELLTKGDDLQPTFDASGNRVFFIRRTWSGMAANYAMWECDLVTRNERLIMADGQAVNSMGTRFVLVQFNREEKTLWLKVSASDRDNSRSIGPGGSPAIATDKDKVMYVGTADYGRSLWLAEPDASPQQLLKVTGTLGPPLFDSTGRYVVVLEKHDGHGATAHIWDTVERKELRTVELD